MSQDAVELAKLKVAKCPHLAIRMAIGDPCQEDSCVLARALLKERERTDVMRAAMRVIARDDMGTKESKAAIAQAYLAAEKEVA